MAAVVVYNEYISDKHHVHMNGTGAVQLSLSAPLAGGAACSSVVSVGRYSYSLTPAPTEAR